jgi:hypothetical protein
MFYIGIDAGTQNTGITILDENQNIIYQTAWIFKNPRKYKNIFEKISFCKNELKKIKKEIIKNEKVLIIIEKSLQMFKSGKSSAKTLSIIAGFNCSISFLCYDIFKVEPIFIGASSARKKCNIPINRESDKNGKQQTLEYIMSNWNFKVEYTKNENIKDYFYDISDSFVLAKSGFSI